MPTEESPSFADLSLSEVPFADLTETAHGRDTKFGGPEAADEIDYRRIRVSVGDKPQSWRVRGLFEGAHRVLPGDMKLYKNWDVWMVAHAVAVHDRGEFATLFNSVVDAVGYEAEFDPAMAATIALQPESSVMRNVGGSLGVSASLGLNGSMLATPEGDVATADIIQPLVGDATLGFAAGAQIFGKLTFGVWTPNVIATGLCSSKCEWLFNRKEAPLRGSQVMLQTILVPAGVETIRFKCRAFALIRSIGFVPMPTRFETRWLEVETSPVAIQKKS